MIRLIVGVIPGIVGVKDVDGILEVANGQGLVKYNGPVTCDLDPANGMWILAGQMRAKSPSDHKMVNKLKPDEIICDVGEDFDQTYSQLLDNTLNRNRSG